MRITLSMIVIRHEALDAYVLVQKRKNTREKDWIDSWELPQGKVVDFNLIKTAQHELCAETGLDLQDIVLQTDFRNYNGILLSFQPFSVVKAKEHLSFHFIAHASGETYDTEEAIDHRWLHIGKLKDFLKSERICPLNLPALEKLANHSFNYIDYAPGLSYMMDCPIVAIDLGGVLLKWNDDLLFSNIANLYKCKKSDVEDILIGEKVRHNLHLGLICHQDLCKKLNGRFGNVSYKQFLDCWETSIEILYNNVEILFGLKKKFPQVKFVVASNIDAVSESIVFERCRLERIFDMLFASWRMNLSKPDPLFFTTISNTLNSNRIMLVDDKKDNLDVAFNMGWSVFQLGSNEAISVQGLSEAVDKLLLKGMS